MYLMFVFHALSICTLKNIIDQAALDICRPASAHNRAVFSGT